MNKVIVFGRYGLCVSDYFVNNLVDDIISTENEKDYERFQFGWCNHKYWKDNLTKFIDKKKLFYILCF